MKSSIPVLHANEERTLAYQLISFIFIAMLLVFVASVLVTRVVYKKIILDSQLDKMRHLVHERVYMMDGILHKVETLANTSVNLLQDNEISSSSLEKHFRNVVLDNRDVHSVTWVSLKPDNEQALLFYPYQHLVVRKEIQGSDYSFNDWYLFPMVSGKSHWIEPWVDEDGDKDFLISYVIPVYNKGEIASLIRYDIALSFLQEKLINTTSFKIGNSFMVSSTGTLITHQDQSLVMNHTLFSLAEEYKDNALKDLGSAMIHGEMGHAFIKGKSPMAFSWIYYQPLSSNHWSVAIAIPERDLMAPINLILVIQTITSLLIFLSVAAIIYARTVSVSKPLQSLAIAADMIGAGDFEAQLPISDKSYEISRLTHSFAAMQKSLKDYIENLKITTEEKNKIRGDVIYASEIQTNLIPKQCTNPFGIKEIRTHGVLEPAGDIGGDLYDFFLIDENHFCFVIADVLGKGIVAAMAMTMVSTLLPSIAPFYKSSSELLQKLNEFLCKNNVEANFVTALLGILNIKTGVLQYSNCGHVPMFIRKIDHSYTCYIETHSTALGVFEDLKIGYDTIHLDKGDEIILFTDGITEAQNSAEDFLGLAGLEAIIEGLQYPNPEKTANSILEAVHEHAKGSTHKDDITLLVLDWKHPGFLDQ